MASLRENRLLCYSLMGAASVVFLLASGLMPELSEYLEVVEFPSEVRVTMIYLTNVIKVVSCSFSIDWLQFWPPI